MCKYCENIDKSARVLGEGDIFFTQSAKYTMVGDGQEYMIPMNYCPNCGEPIALKRLIAHETLVNNIKRKATEINDKKSIEFSRLVLYLMNEYKINQQTAEEFIKYAEKH